MSASSDHMSILFKTNNAVKNGQTDCLKASIDVGANERIKNLIDSTSTANTPRVQEHRHIFFSPMRRSQEGLPVRFSSTDYLDIEDNQALYNRIKDDTIADLCSKMGETGSNLSFSEVLLHLAKGRRKVELIKNYRDKLQSNTLSSLLVQKGTPLTDTYGERPHRRGVSLCSLANVEGMKPGFERSEAALNIYLERAYDSSPYRGATAFGVFRINGAISMISETNNFDPGANDDERAKMWEEFFNTFMKNRSPLLQVEPTFKNVILASVRKQRGRIEFAHSDPRCFFSRENGPDNKLSTVYNDIPKKDLIMEDLATKHGTMLGLQADNPGTATFLTNLGSWVWLFAVWMPYERGSASISEWYMELMTKIVLKKNLSITLRPDIRAFIEPNRETFAEQFTTLVKLTELELPEEDHPFNSNSAKCR